MVGRWGGWGTVWGPGQSLLSLVPNGRGDLVTCTKRQQGKNASDVQRAVYQFGETVQRFSTDSRPPGCLGADQATTSRVGPAGQ